MNKHEFLAALRRELTALPHDELTEQLNFYNEMIDDRMEEGMTEEEAVAAVGSVESIAAGIKEGEETAPVADVAATTAAENSPFDTARADSDSAEADSDYEEAVSDFAETVSDFSETVTDFKETVSDFAETAAHGESKSSREKKSLPLWEILLIVLGAPLWIPLVVAVAAVVLSMYVTLWAVVGSLWAIPASLAACALTGCLGTIPLLFSGKWIAALLWCGIGLASGGLAIFAIFGCAAATKGAAQLTKLGCKGIKALFTSRRKGNES